MQRQPNPGPRTLIALGALLLFLSVFLGPTAPTQGGEEIDRGDLLHVIAAGGATASKTPYQCALLRDRGCPTYGWMMRWWHLGGDLTLACPIRSQGNTITFAYTHFKTHNQVWYLNPRLEETGADRTESWTPISAGVLVLSGVLRRKGPFFIPIADMSGRGRRTYTAHKAPQGTTWQPARGDWYDVDTHCDTVNRAALLRWEAEMGLIWARMQEEGRREVDPPTREDLPALLRDGPPLPGEEEPTYVWRLKEGYPETEDRPTPKRGSVWSSSASPGSLAAHKEMKRDDGTVRDSADYTIAIGGNVPQALHPGDTFEVQLAASGSWPVFKYPSWMSARITSSGFTVTTRPPPDEGSSAKGNPNVLVGRSGDKEVASDTRTWILTFDGSSDEVKLSIHLTSRVTAVVRYVWEKVEE